MVEDIFIDRFVNLNDRYARQMVDGSYRVIPEPVTPELIRAHLTGRLTLALPALDANSMCKWCAWDSDNANGDLFKIEQLLLEVGFYPLREGGRPHRDGHLWLFFDEKVRAANLIAFDQEIKAHAEVEDMEFFPKQASFNKSPNALRAPWGINRKPEANGSIGRFDACPEQDAIIQLQWLAGQQLNSSQKINAIANKLLKHKQLLGKYTCKRKKVVACDPAEVFADLDPEFHGSYYSCDCPGCGERRAYFYPDGQQLICNRENNCGYRVTCQEWLNR